MQSTNHITHRVLMLSSFETFLRSQFHFYRLSYAISIYHTTFISLDCLKLGTHASNSKRCKQVTSHDFILFLPSFFFLFFSFNFIHLSIVVFDMPMNRHLPDPTKQKRQTLSVGLRKKFTYLNLLIGFSLFQMYSSCSLLTWSTSKKCHEKKSERS